MNTIKDVLTSVLLIAVTALAVLFTVIVVVGTLQWAASV